MVEVAEAALLGAVAYTHCASGNWHRLHSQQSPVRSVRGGARSNEGTTRGKARARGKGIVGGGIEVGLG